MTMHSSDPASVQIAALQREGFDVEPARAERRAQRERDEQAAERTEYGDAWLAAMHRRDGHPEA